MDEKIRAKFFSRRFSGIQDTIWGRNGKKLEDDLFVDVDPINYEVWHVFIGGKKYDFLGNLANS